MKTLSQSLQSLLVSKFSYRLTTNPNLININKLSSIVKLLSSNLISVNLIQDLSFLFFLSIFFNLISFFLFFSFTFNFNFLDNEEVCDCSYMTHHIT